MTHKGEISQVLARNAEKPIKDYCRYNVVSSSVESNEKLYFSFEKRLKRLFIVISVFGIIVF